MTRDAMIEIPAGTFCWALGLTILATVANSRTQDAFGAGVHNPAVAWTKGFERAFLVAAAVRSWGGARRSADLLAR